LSVLAAKLIGGEFGFVEFVAGGNQMKAIRASLWAAAVMALGTQFGWRR